MKVKWIWFWLIFLYAACLIIVIVIGRLEGVVRSTGNCDDVVVEEERPSWHGQTVKLPPDSLRIMLQVTVTNNDKNNKGKL